MTNAEQTVAIKELNDALLALAARLEIVERKTQQIPTIVAHTEVEDVNNV